jgi:hypothetical protein
MRGNQFDVPTPDTVELAGFWRPTDLAEFMQYVRECGHVRRRADEQGVLREVRLDATQEPAAKPPTFLEFSREALRASLREKLKQRL